MSHTKMLNMLFYCEFHTTVSYISGITPKITNEVGLYIETKLAESGSKPQAAMLNASGTKLHHMKSSKDRANEDKTLVAFPNDRAQSVRPSNRKETYKYVWHYWIVGWGSPDFLYGTMGITFKCVTFVWVLGIFDNYSLELFSKLAMVENYYFGIPF